MSKEVLIKTVEGQDQQAGVDKFISFVNDLREKYFDTEWPSEETMRSNLENKELFFYFAENSKGEAMGALVVSPYLHIDGRRGANGIYLVTARARDKKRPIGAILLNHLKQDFDLIELKANLFGIKRYHDGFDVPRLTQRLISYYKALGFIAPYEEKSNSLLWEKRKSNDGF